MISVAIATFNGEYFLDEQIQSILNQTLKPTEIIVCDDCSTDNTVEILEKYNRKGVLTYHINSTRLGLIDNFKKAVSLCDTENYISLSDQDDIWLPEKLETCAAAMMAIENKQLPCMVYSDLIFVDSKKRILNKSFRNEAGQDSYTHNLESLLFNNFVNGCTVLINKPLRILFDSTLSEIYFNHDGWLALLAFSFGKVKNISQPLVFYRKHESNLSIDINKIPRSRYQNLYDQIMAALKGSDNFLVEQLNAVNKFYEQFKSGMDTETKLTFENFLTLNGKSYFVKKIVYKRMINKLKVKR